MCTIKAARSQFIAILQTKKHSKLVFSPHPPHIHEQIYANYILIMALSFSKKAPNNMYSCHFLYSAQNFVCKKNFLYVHLYVQCTHSRLVILKSPIIHFWCVQVCLCACKLSCGSALCEQMTENIIMLGECECSKRIWIFFKFREIQHKSSQCMKKFSEFW